MVGETKLRILKQAVTPSRYIDLERSSGVSKSIFNKHLNDLLNEGLIEKTEEGLYVITEKGLKILMRSLENERRGIIHKVRDSLLGVRKEYPEEVVNTFLNLGLKFLRLEECNIDLSFYIEKLTLSDIPNNIYDKAVSLIELVSRIIELNDSLSIYIVEKLRLFRKYYVKNISNQLAKMITAEEELRKKMEDLTLPFSTIVEIVNEKLNMMKRILDELIETNEKLRLLAENHKDNELSISYTYIRINLEELNEKIERALHLISEITN